MVKKMQKRWSGRFKFEWDVPSCHTISISDHHLHVEKHVDFRLMSAAPVLHLGRLNPGESSCLSTINQATRLKGRTEMQLGESTSEETSHLEEKEKRMESSEDNLKESPVPDAPSNNRSGKKEQNLRDSLHEKVFPDEAWLVTSLPKGYECIDAMFMVEAEGTCMLQQEIPVESVEENVEESEQIAAGTPCPEEEEEEEEEEEKEKEDEKALPTEQEVLSPWSFPLLPGALETEEEKEMMEQKLVLEPRLIENKFISVSLEYLEDSEDEAEDNVGTKEKEEEEKCPCNSSLNVEQLRIVKAEEEEEEEKEDEKGREVQLECAPCPSSPSIRLQNLRVADSHVVCH